MRWSCRLPERALCWCLGFYPGQLVVLCPLGFPGSILLCTWLRVALLLCPGLPVGRLSHVAWHEAPVQTASCPAELQCVMVMSGSCGFLTSGEKVNIDPWNPTQTEAPLHPEPAAPMLRRTLPQHSVGSVWPRIAC